jgi:predicted nucleic acid-binding protein
MRYLLDISALIALALAQHEFHDRVAVWVRDEQPEMLATSSITELGFVRVLAQVPAYGQSVAQAKALLERLKNNRTIPFEFLADANDISRLPAWVRSPKQITDGHLAQLAKDHDMTLATLDEKLIGAFLIPERRRRSRR